MNGVLAYFDARDHRVARRLSGWRPPRWFRIWMLAATRLGDGWLWVATGGMLIAAGREQRTAQQAAALTLLATNAAVIALKRCCRRRRPGVHTANGFFQVGPPGLYAFDQFSFPSGHSMNAAAAATIIGLAFPILTPLAVFVAGSIGLSRVVLRVHFLSDVLVGAVLGLVIGAGSWGVVASRA